MPISLFDEFFRIVAVLNDKQVPYAICGGMAVSLYTEPRATKDIDILLCTKDLEPLRAAITTVGYRQWAPPWTFRSSGLTLNRFLRFDGPEYLVVDVLTGPQSEYEKMVANAIVEQTPQGPVRLVAREDLITLKRARNSLLDQADIAALQNDPRGKNRSRSEQPPGLLHPDGTPAPSTPTPRSPARRRPVAKKPKKVPRRRPKK
jgi:hypothetical protein